MPYIGFEPFLENIMSAATTMPSPGFRGAAGISTEPCSAPDRPAAMTGESIICFAKDWDEDPTCNNHIMRLFARDNRVLWLNSIGTRKPNLRDRRDLSKIFRKILSFFRGPRNVSDGLWVYTPIVLPFPHSRVATRLNAWILRATLLFLRRRLGIREFQLWMFLPTAAVYAGKLGESLLVYYVTDEWSKFGYVDERGVAANDLALCKNADVVFCTARLLCERRKKLNREVHLSLHGVEQSHFAAALEEQTEVPIDIANLSGPILGFFGWIHEWIDLALIEFVASRHPEWTIVMIGKASVDVSHMDRYQNVHFLGRRSYKDLPGYCRGFDVGLIPFVVNELTVNVNPIKLREYLSAGLPVVSTALPEVEGFEGDCYVAHDYESFMLGVERAMREDNSASRHRRSASMRSEMWEFKIVELGRRTTQVACRKSRDTAANKTIATPLTRI